MKSGRALILFLAALLGGCLSPKATRCGDGRVCPANTRCDVQNNRCVGALEEKACTGLLENATCSLLNAPGVCKQGVCKPFYCGDGILNLNEECDTLELGGKSCTDLHYYKQTTGLACTADCKFDRRGCEGICGDGVINGGEQCDGADLGGADCRTLGFYSPAGLKCSASCLFDQQACTGKCGNGVVDGVEACDGAPPAGKSCLDYGFDRGLLGCSSLCGVALEGCRSFGWTSIVSPAKTLLVDMWASGPNDVFALDVSGSTLVAHWDGVGWSPMPTGVPEPARLMSIWGSASNDLYVGGQSRGAGFIRHWDGKAWGTVGFDLTVPEGVFMPGGSYIADLWGTGPKDVFAVGAYIGGLAMHWNGTSWSTTNFVGAGAFPAVGRLWGTGPRDVFAVGGSGTVHWDGAQWSVLRVETMWPLFDIAGSGGADVLAVGPTIEGTQSGSNILRFDGVSWSPAPVNTIVSPAGIWQGELDDVFLLGVKSSAGDKSGVLFRWTGRDWDKVRVKLPGQLTLGTTFPGGVLARGEDGTVARWDYTRWSADGVLANGVWGDGPNDAVSVGLGAIYHWDGTGWFAMATATPLAKNLNAVWGSSPGDRWAVGEGGTILHWDGAVWAAAAAGIPAVALRAVWGASRDDVWAVGDGGTLVHWNGQAWTAVASGRTQDFSGVWGSGANDVYVVGPDKGGDNAVMHFDGAAWRAVFSAAAPLRCVWGSGAGDVYVGGEGGTIVRWDGAAWTKMDSRSTQTIFGLGGRGAFDVFAAADRSLLHLQDGAWEQVSLPGANQLRGVSVMPSRVFVVGALPEAHLERNVTCVGPERACNDGWDNDCDGRTDAADADCGGSATEVCANLADDDHDGRIDCNDPDCGAFPSCKKP